MKVSESFSSTFFKAADISTPKLLTIQAVIHAKMPEGNVKPAIQFFGTDQQLVLNKTNALTLAQIYGDEMTLWAGKPVELFHAQTQFQGSLKPCIRVRVPAAPAAAPAPPVQVPASIPAGPQPQPGPLAQPAAVPPQPAEVQQPPARSQPPAQPQPTNGVQAPPMDYPSDV